VFDSLIAVWFLAGAPAVARQATERLTEALPRKPFIERQFPR
jgi:hypothetical protein